MTRVPMTEQQFLTRAKIGLGGESDPQILGEVLPEFLRSHGFDDMAQVAHAFTAGIYEKIADEYEIGLRHHYDEERDIIENALAMAKEKTAEEAIQYLDTEFNRLAARERAGK